MYIAVTPSESGFVFRPALASLSVEGKRFAGLAGFEFGLWNRDGKRAAEGGSRGHWPVGAEWVLSEPGRKYFLSIDFATPVPSPGPREIAIGLSRALASPRQPAVPLIRFMPVRWKEGYS